MEIKYETVFARSFSRHYGLEYNDHAIAGNKTVEMKLSCNFESRSDFCEIKGDTRIHGIASTIFIASPQEGNVAGNGSWAIIPYARKEDKQAMGQCRNWTLRSVMDHKQVPHCTVNHSIPAILFSTGGYAGNHFHDFSDVLIPLYITSKHFNREVQLLCSNMKAWWMKKHNAFLENLSRYDIIDIDSEEEIHCFTSVIIGLKSHKELSIDPSKSPNGLSMKDFGHFLRNSFSLKRDTAIKLKNKDGKRPRLMIITRRKSRVFLNEGGIVHLAKSLGFDVVVAEANTSTDLSQFAHTVNSCDVLVGIHGAGLTNMVFLPEKAILIQVVPVGIGWLAQYDFGGPAMEMNLKYLEYKIRPGESSLIEQYPLNHAVFQDPVSIHNQGWDVIRATYLDNQNVKIDVCRFRATLLKALRFLHK
ncbi:Glycosyltransferase 61 [Dillenia turbinata]|uniref:Glycosyltransferase 61 n=1 Tax=Dillenia turbinata TaxID=194707 RepID=A0AAN8Z4Y9_9MAGN